MPRLDMYKCQQRALVEGSRETNSVASRAKRNKILLVLELVSNISFFSKL